MGNITSIVKGSNEYRSYLYDSLGQLTQERNVSSSTMTSFSYNHLGNIVEKHINDYNGINEKAKVRYGYSADSNAGWKYLLTSITTEDYTSGTTVTTTETIDYDAIGNPITYRGAAMAWRGRQLTGHTKNGVTSTFSYDADGLRSTKTVGGVKTEYQYVGDQLFYEKRGDSQEFYYFYDSYGNLSKIYYTFNNLNNNTTSRAIYHALTNAQGDVIALYNSSGSLVAQYEYDAWGNTLSIKNASGATIDAWYNIAVANPIRYRGYYYDADLGLYYLQSRYYDSTIGRFINADGYLTTGQGVLSYNMYAYCNNNPVMFSDPTGEFGLFTLLGIVAVIACVVGLGSYPTPSDYRSNETINQNCYTYAFNLDGCKNPGDYSANSSNSKFSCDESYSENEIAEWVIRDMEYLGKSVRILSSPKDISREETLVAMKVVNTDNGEVFDYHFAVQLKNGKWADKVGPFPSRYNKIDGYAIKWEINEYKIYDSGTVYFAVRG